MNINSVFTIAFFALTSTLFVSCSSPKSTAEGETTKIQPKFDYAPKVLNQVGSTEITIALVNPIYGDPDLSISPFEDMRKNMANDFEELLTAKGFKIRGPFNQVGEMLYTDKVNSNFVLSVEIDLNFKTIDRKVRTMTSTDWAALLLTSSSGLDVSYMYYGEGNFVCNLVLTASSSKFGEKLWKKNITLPATHFKYVGKTRWSSNNVGFYNEVKQDNAVFNEVAKLLEGQYQAILDLVEKQIDVEEMKTVATEARKVDGKN